MRRRALMAHMSVPLVALVGVVLAGEPASSGSPTEAPGRIFAVSWKVDAPSLVSMLPDGSDRRTILDLGAGLWRTGSIDVAPDGGSVMSLAEPAAFDLYTVSSDGVDFSPVTTVGSWPAASFSPSGDRIAAIGRFEGARVLARMRSDGTRQKVIVDGAEPAPDLGAGVSWSPNGEHIAYVTRGDGQSTVVVTEPSGTWFRFVRAFSTKGYEGSIQSISWSSDSSTLLISRYDGAGRQTDLWTLTVATAALSRVTDTPHLVERSGTYAPDDSAIAAFVVPVREGWCDVVVMDADGTNRHRIETPRPFEVQPVWSP